MQCLQNRVVVVACGVGRDSTGMLVGLHERNIRPEAILFADVGGDYGKRCVMFRRSRVGIAGYCGSLPLLYIISPSSFPIIAVGVRLKGRGG